MAKHECNPILIQEQGWKPPCGPGPKLTSYSCVQPVLKRCCPWSRGLRLRIGTPLSTYYHCSYLVVSLGVITSRQMNIRKNKRRKRKKESESRKIYLILKKVKKGTPVLSCLHSLLARAQEQAPSSSKLPLVSGFILLTWHCFSC